MLEQLKKLRGVSFADCTVNDAIDGRLQKLKKASVVGLMLREDEVCH